VTSRPPTTRAERDPLPPEEYAAEHLPGAVNVPLKQLDAETTAQLDQHRPVAVYCL
jgi:rhodanese-related sulfurtransferase